MRRVIIESPYAGDVAENIKYARQAIRDSLNRCESPFALHLLYTYLDVLDYNVQIDRYKGIAAGLAWHEVADAVIVYQDLGISKGMKQSIEAAKLNKVPVEYRSILS